MATPPFFCPPRLCAHWPEMGKMTTLDLWPIPWGGGAWGAGTNMWHPETPASYESLPAPLATQIPTLWIHTSGGGGGGVALLLDRCGAFDLFASVDAHLCHWPFQQSWQLRMEFPELRVRARLVALLAPFLKALLRASEYGKRCLFKVRPI